jgi:hypothetical protein
MSVIARNVHLHACALITSDVETAWLWYEHLNASSATFQVDTDAITHVAWERAAFVDTADLQAMLGSTQAVTASSGSAIVASKHHRGSMHGYVHIQQGANIPGQMVMARDVWMRFVAIASCLKDMLEQGHNSCFIVWASRVDTSDKLPIALLDMWRVNTARSTTVVKPTRACPPRVIHTSASDSFVLHIHDTLTAFATMQRWVDRQHRGSVTSVLPTLPPGTEACNMFALLRKPWPLLVENVIVTPQHTPSIQSVPRLTVQPVLSVIFDLRDSLGPGIDELLKPLAIYYRQYTQPDSDELARFQVLVLTSHDSRNTLGKSIEWIDSQYASEPGFLMLVDTDIRPKWVDTVWTPLVAYHVQGTPACTERWNSQLYHFLNNPSTPVVRGEGTCCMASEQRQQSYPLYNRAAWKAAVHVFGNTNPVNNAASAQKFFEVVSA